MTVPQATRLTHKPARLTLEDGAHCSVVGGTHAGKSGVVADIKTGKTGHVSITVIQANGVRFKTLARNVVVHNTRAIRTRLKL